MTGELEKEQAMLLQLRESLKVYHSLKKKYEELMAEVHQLEAEKSNLAEQLKKATADPSTGCSAVIKRKLEKVELSLSRARRETLSHRQKYKLAEEQAKKCHMLERRISELKKAKITLVKKQKEAAARYKETTEAKTKELLTLKRKEKATEMKMSKLETEIQYHKNNLQKRRNYCTNLSEKLKQTESHLMKLLSMRQRDLVERTSISGNSRRTMTDSALDLSGQHDNKRSKTYAMSIEEFQSAKVMFDRMVCERVKQGHLQDQYEERVAVYSDAMRTVVSEVKLLTEARRNLGKDHVSEESMIAVQELEQSVADLELTLELLGSELEEMRSNMPQDVESARLDDNEGVKNMISSMSAQVLRIMLTETFSKLVQTEVRFSSPVEVMARSLALPEFSHCFRLIAKITLKVPIAKMQLC
jgi:multidrug efflux pump subunit AcrA (membrane-fusion protein)